MLKLLYLHSKQERYMNQINQAFIFAAGRGERMRPITDAIPKPLVKVHGRPIIDYIIEKLNRLSFIKKIVVNGFYLSSQIEEYLNSLDNPKIIFSAENTKLETGGGLLFASHHLNFKEPILLINGDIFWQETGDISDLELIIKNYDLKESDILLGLKKKEEVISDNQKQARGDFNFDPITKELSKPHDKNLSHIFIGIQVINPAIFNNSPPSPFSMNYFYKQALSPEFTLSRIKGIEMNGKFFHIDSVDALKTAEEMINKT